MSTVSRIAAARVSRRINVTDKTGKLISIQAVSDDNDLMIINRSGITIRTAVEGIRIAGRATQGVKIINLREGDTIASVVAVPKSDDAQEDAVSEARRPTSRQQKVKTRRNLMNDSKI